jgi:hypothetical protein
LNLIDLISRWLGFKKAEPTSRETELSREQFFAEAFADSLAKNEDWQMVQRYLHSSGAERDATRDALKMRADEIRSESTDSWQDTLRNKRAINYDPYAR